ncbi:ribonuclease-like [Emydura macquarii macquarii]|uniref:ribonuclease-like n=1 Tax=Emydura macquarii macquarii TaxID=1129001 RepID=UPI00352ACA94
MGSPSLIVPARKMTVGPALLLLLVLWPAAAQEESPYEKFQRQHVDTAPGWEQDLDLYCKLMIQRRNVSVDFCKPVNSFIHKELEVITAVCGAAGTPCPGNYHYSNSNFTVTDCRAMGAWPNCNYRGSQDQKQICLACDNGEPVHYGRPAECGKKAGWGGN